MLSLLARYVPSVLPFLGRVAKGHLTKIGDAGSILSTVVGLGASHIVTDQNLVPLVHEVCLVLIVFFQTIGGMGYGRKARDAHLADVAAPDSVG